MTAMRKEAGMIPHPLLPHFLRIAYECMGCDGEIADSEISCLRSVAVQLGQPVEQVDGSLETIRAEFSTDASSPGTRARNLLRDADMAIEDAMLLLDLLVQMVEADGKVHLAESRYIRDLIDGLGLDRAALRRERPEWRSYLVEGFGVVREVGPPYAGRLADTIGDLPELAPKSPRE